MQGFVELETRSGQSPDCGVLTPGAGSRLLIQNVKDGIAIIQDDVITLANPSLLEIAGCQEQEMVSRPFLEFIHPDDRRMAAEHHSRRMRGEEVPSGITLRVIDGHGACRWVDSKALLIVWNGAPATLCFLTDITESKRMQESLRASEEALRKLVEGTTDMAWELNESSICTFVSPQVRSMLGYSPSEVLGHSPMEFLPPDEAAKFARMFEAAMVEPESKALINFTFIHKRGRHVTVETSAVPILTSGHLGVGFRGIARDVTEREEMKRQVQDGLRKLESTIDRTIQAISLIVEARDGYTAGHQKRTSQLSCAIAERMGLPKDQVRVVQIAALLHDIGKIAVPSEILTKPGRLSAMEIELIRTHSRVGYEILRTVDFPWPIADIVHQHHERLDGSGYPLGLKDEDISIEAKILAVADVVEAMTSRRPYRLARGIEEALAEISVNSGRLYDGDVVFACLDVFNGGGFSFENAALLSEWYHS